MAAPITLAEVEWFRFDASLLSHLPIFVFAFTCHQNVRIANFNLPAKIFSIFNELQDNSQQRMRRVINQSVGVSYLVYLVIGVLGYLTFGAAVTSNIMQMYPHHYAN